MSDSGNILISGADVERITGLKLEGAKLHGYLETACTLTNLKNNSFFFADTLSNNFDYLKRFSEKENILGIFKNDQDIPLEIPHILCEHPRKIFGKLVRFVYKYEENFINYRVLDPSELIKNRNIRVGNFVVVSDDAEIGEGTTIQSNVVIGPKTKIGKNCLIMSGCTIGAQGFGPARFEEEVVSMPHIGGVNISDNVELGAGTIVDAGTIEPTKIKNFVKTGSLVHVAHNVVIGRGCFLAARSGLSGSVEVGENTFIGAGAMVRDGVRIGSGVTIGMQSAVLSDIKNGLIVFGNPARPKKK